MSVLDVITPGSRRHLAAMQPGLFTALIDQIHEAHSDQLAPHEEAFERMVY